MFREEQFNLPRCSIVRREAVSAVKSAKAVAMGALGRPDLPMAKSRYPTSYRGLTVPILEPENPAHHTPSSSFVGASGIQQAREKQMQALTYEAAGTAPLPSGSAEVNTV